MATKLKYCVVDAFTDEAFKGNPAAVCLLEEERDEEWLKAVAREFNSPVTCYLTRLTHSDSANAPLIPRFLLRWFTTVSENGGSTENWFIELNFPVIPIMEYDYAADVMAVSKSLNGASVMEIKKTTLENDLFVVLPSGKEVAEVEPQFDQIKNCPGRGILITGPAPAGSGYDFVSRLFCRKLGLNEDYVCGSAHCSLAPYWSKRLGKCDFVAYQASPRSAVLYLHLDENNQRVLIRGKATAVMEGSLLV